MDPIKIGSVRNIEMPHKFLKVGQRSLDQQVKMIGHQHISENLNLVNFPRSPQKIQKSLPVGIIAKDLLPGIPPAGNMIVGILKLDAQRPCHKKNLESFFPFVKIKDLTPITLFN